MDHLSDEDRSALMARVRSSGTRPELKVRKLAHAMGLRFRLNRRDLPGTPDLVFPRHRVAVFIHGCFWHRHPGCSRATVPKSRVEFWTDKFEANVARDRRDIHALVARGWHVLVLWECELKNDGQLRDRLREAIHCVQDYCNIGPYRSRSERPGLAAKALQREQGRRVADIATGHPAATERGSSSFVNQIPTSSRICRKDCEIRCERKDR
jgi:DNA mismatch endonuclease, patch repair protein